MIKAGSNCTEWGKEAVLCNAVLYLQKDQEDLGNLFLHVDPEDLQYHADQPDLVDPKDHQDPTENERQYLTCLLSSIFLYNIDRGHSSLCLYLLIEQSIPTPIFPQLFSQHSHQLPPNSITHIG